MRRRVECRIDMDPAAKNKGPVRLLTLAAREAVTLKGLLKQALAGQRSGPGAPDAGCAPAVGKA